MKLSFCLLILMLAYPGTAQKCVDPSKRSSAATKAGANELIRQVEERPLRELVGRVANLNGEPIDFVLVEVFDRPEWIREGAWGPTGKQRRIIGCAVGGQGEFRIKGLTPGVYEIRLSAGGGFNVSHIYVTLDPSKGEKRQLLLEMRIGT